MLQLRALDGVHDGGDISELAHALQTATRAQRAGADDELLLGALLHDVGKVFGDIAHGDISAAFLSPHVRPEVVEVVRHHPAFTASHWDPSLKGDADPRRAFADEPWFGLASQFVDEWDMQSFDPTYDSLSLDDFEPLVLRLVTGA